MSPIRSAVVLAGLFLAGSAVADNDEQCAVTDLTRNAAASQRNVTATLLVEIQKHRYEDCSQGTECSVHIAELATAMNHADEMMLAECPGYDKWQAGISGLIDPRTEPNGTLQQYGDDLERQALYERIVESALADIPADQEDREVVMTMGAPGSGKGYVLKHLGLCQSDVVLVDPDEFKKRLAEYQGAIAADDTLAADRVHRESSMLSKRTRDRAIATHRNLCIDGVLSKRASAIELIDRLQAAGYEVTLVAASVPFDVTYARVLARGEQTGRFVPYEFAKQAHANIESHADELLRRVDHGFLYDTNQPYGEPPLLTGEYQNGEKLNDQN